MRVAFFRTILFSTFVVTKALHDLLGIKWLTQENKIRSQAGFNQNLSNHQYQGQSFQENHRESV